jgi:flavodoxin
MSKILITYFSQTGNTKQIAESIYESLQGDKTIKPVDEVQKIEDYSLLFIGFPVHSHGGCSRSFEQISRTQGLDRYGCVCPHSS